MEICKLGLDSQINHECIGLQVFYIISKQRWRQLIEIYTWKVNEQNFVNRGINNNEWKF